MKYAKILGLLAVAAAALMAFAGTASATITVNGSAYSGHIEATSTNTELDGTVDVKCAKSIVTGNVSNGATTSAVTTLDFTECGSDTVEVTRGGSLRVDSSGTVYSEDAEVTVTVHRSIFGFPVTTHCEYVTAKNPGTDIGTLTEHVSPPQVHLIGANIPQTETDSGCGANAQWTGTYTFTTPTGAITVD